MRGSDITECFKQFKGQDPSQNEALAILKLLAKAQELKLEAKQEEEEKVIEEKTKEVKEPPDFLCPISTEVMMDPVFAHDGYSYERVNIEGFFDSQRNLPVSPSGKSNQILSPMTGLPLEHLNLTPNHNLRSQISEWKTKNKQ